MITENYRSFLLEELRKRQRKNPAYSLRAFARDLGIASSRLSEIINSKVGLSEDKASIIADKLQLGEDEKSLFIDLVQSEHARSTIAKQSALSRVRARLLDTKKIEEKDFALISDWQNLAILELLEIQGLEHSYESFAHRLGMTTVAVAESIERLVRVGFLRQENGRWYASQPDSTTSADIPSESIQRYHSQMLDRARRSLERDPVQTRDFSTIVFSLSSDQLTYAKERIREFRRMLTNELAAMPAKDKVYSLSVQLFELKGDDI